MAVGDRDCRGVIVRPSSALRNVFALINPALHANHAVGCLRPGSAVIDVRAESLQRQTSLQVPLFSRDFRAVQPPSNTDLNPLPPKTHTQVNPLPHRPPKAHPL